MEKIFDDIAGHRWKFFVAEKNLLYDKDGTGECVLFEGVASEFDVSPDRLGHINIIVVTDRGDLVYLKYDFHSWTKYTVMESKNGNAGIYSIRLFSISQRMNLWYCFEYAKKNLLVHQIFDGPQMIGKANVVDILGSRKCFSVCCDNDLNTHILYVNEDEKSRYKIYKWSKKEYEEKDFDFDDILSISSATDPKGTLHIVFTSRKQDYNVVCYSQMGSPAIKTVGFGIGVRCVPAIIVSKEVVVIQFCDNFEAAQCKSIDGGKTFSGAKTVDALKGGLESYGAYRYGKNGLCIGIDRVLLSGASRDIFQESEILSLFSESESRAGSEVEEYYANTKDSMCVSIDFVSRLNSIEEKISKLYELLDKKTESENKKLLNEENFDKENYEIFKNIDINNL